MKILEMKYRFNKFWNWFWIALTNGISQFRISRNLFFFCPNLSPISKIIIFSYFFSRLNFIWFESIEGTKKKHFDSQWIYCFWPTKNYVHFEALNISEKIKVMDCCSRQKKTEAWKCRWLPFQNDIRYICINQAVRMSESEIL